MLNVAFSYCHVNVIMQSVVMMNVFMLNVMALRFRSALLHWVSQSYLGWLTLATEDAMSSNGKESTVNRALGGSTYPG